MTGTINLTEKLATFDQHGPPQTVTQFAGLASPVRLPSLRNWITVGRIARKGNGRGDETAQ